MKNIDDILSKAMNFRQAGSDISSLFDGSFVKRQINKFMGRNFADKLFIKKFPWEN